MLQSSQPYCFHKMFRLFRFTNVGHLRGKAENMASDNTASNDVKESTVKTTPRDARVMQAILKETGVNDYEPRVINQMLEFTYRYVTDVLEDARVYCNHANKKEIDADDIKLAVQIRMDNSFTNPPPRDFLMEIGRQKNNTPLPLIQPRSGLRLPPDRYCLLSNNYRVKQQQKKSQVRTVPAVPARSLPYFPKLSPSVGVKINQPSVGIAIKTPTTPSTLTPRTNIIAPPMSKPVAMTTLTINKPLGHSITTSVPQTKANVSQPSTQLSSNNQTRNTSMSTVSALPSMDETVASSLQQQALVSSLHKRKREGEDDDYDA